ncbi:MAG: hypothetical protein WC516_03545 [Patescibacteria group bacterium]
MAKLQTNKGQKIISLAILVFAFQMVFPQYAHAQAVSTTSVIDEPKASYLYVTNSPQLIMFSSEDNSGWQSLPVAPLRQPRKITVEITAYSSTVDQCDSDPFTTANGSRVRDGIVAANFVPFHTKVKIPSLYGDKVFSVEDRMNRRFANRMDIWMVSRQEAIKFGIKEIEIEVFD